MRGRGYVLGSLGAGDDKVDAFGIGGGGIADEQDAGEGVAGLALHEQIHGHIGTVDDICAQALLADGADGIEHLGPVSPSLARHADDGDTTATGAESDEAHAVALAQVVDQEAQSVAEQVDLQALHGRGYGDDDDDVDGHVYRGRGARLGHAGARGAVLGRGGHGGPGGTIGRVDGGEALGAAVVVVVGARVVVVVVGHAGGGGEVEADVHEGTAPEVELAAVVELQVEGGQLGDGEAEGQDEAVGRVLDVVEVLLDEDGALEGAFCLGERGGGVPLGRRRRLLLLDADEHLGEEVALELLPRLAVLADADVAVEAQLAEAREVEAVPVVDAGMQVFGHVVEQRGRLVLGRGRPAGDGRLGALVVALGHAGERRLRRRRSRQVVEAGPPLALDDLDGDKARQALLLSRPAQRGELAADGDGGRGDGTPDAAARAAEARLHGLHVVVVPPPVVRRGILARRREARRAGIAASVGPRLRLRL